MSNGSELKSRSAMALREAGFFPLPRLWVKAEDLDMVYYMASKHSEEVSRIRAEAMRSKSEQIEKQRQIDLAWEQRNKQDDQ